MIELKEIVKKYTFGDSELLALDHVNLTINKGEMVAVMGASGSGKSTLLNVIGAWTDLTVVSIFWMAIWSIS